MYKRMLRSALAVVFSAVAVFGAVSAVNGDAGSALASDSGWNIVPTGPTGKTDSGWNSAPVDSGWNTAPAGQAGEPDSGWNTAPVKAL
ncbi:hypothetical protein ABZZ17_33480 [Streptomyces sp. NPDC006512]|uniref:hypothetical protein n=1 Tax=Streptomyces sp. NPDC006512 TaxID=3154307 RepID=UPI0033BBC396